MKPKVKFRVKQYCFNGVSHSDYSKSQNYLFVILKCYMSLVDLISYVCKDCFVSLKSIVLLPCKIEMKLNKIVHFFSGGVLKWEQQCKIIHMCTRKYLTIKDGHVTLTGDHRDPTTVFRLHPVIRVRVNVISSLNLI